MEGRIHTFRFADFPGHFRDAAFSVFSKHLNVPVRSKRVWVGAEARAISPLVKTTVRHIVQPAPKVPSGNFRIFAVRDRNETGVVAASRRFIAGVTPHRFLPLADIHLASTIHIATIRARNRLDPKIDFLHCEVPMRFPRAHTGPARTPSRGSFFLLFPLFFGHASSPILRKTRLPTIRTVPILLRIILVAIPPRLLQIDRNLAFASTMFGSTRFCTRAHNHFFRTTTVPRGTGVRIRGRLQRRCRGRPFIADRRESRERPIHFPFFSLYG